MTDSHSDSHKKAAKKGTALSTRMIAGLTVLLTAMLVTVGLVLYLHFSAQLEREARERINMAVETTRHMIDQAVSHTIQGQLKASAERNQEIVSLFYREFKAGHLTEQEAKKRAANVLLSQTIGKTGYMYAVDSKGFLRVHPKAALVNVDISQNAFVQEQIRRKSGYLEYKWKNPGEKVARDKSLFMSYFEPWDYIISATAYREEFLYIFNLQKLRKEILSLKFGKKGYAYVMDMKGTLLIHPKLQGKNIYDSRDAEGRYFIREMCQKKSGTITYPWKNPGDKVAREKNVVFQYYPALDIIVAGGIYRDELFAPLNNLRNRLITILVIMLLLILPLAFASVRAITQPILGLSNLSSKIAGKDLRVLDEFDHMQKENTRLHRRFAGNSRELMSLLKAFRNAGLSIRALVFELISNAQKLSRQAGTIEKAVAESNASASRLSSTAEEISRSIGSLGNAFQKTENIAHDVFTVSRHALLKGQEGNDSVKMAQASMSTISQTANAARVQMNKLENLSAQIAEAVKSLAQIGDSSQMLAINASIEAAEAGEAGRGFAAVATEIQEFAVENAKTIQVIRDILQQIAGSAGTAIRMTDDTKTAVANGENSMKQLEQLLQSLIAVLDSNNQHADQISRTVTEQNSAISQISQAVAHVLENSQQGTRNVADLLEAIDELNRTRDEFERLAKEYKV